MTASTVTTVLHFAIGDGHFHILYALVGILVGAMQGASDNVLQYRKKFLERGNAENSRVGMLLPQVVQRAWVAVSLSFVRLQQGLAIGMLGGLCMILAAMQPGIENYSVRKFTTDNLAASAEATKLVDAGISRTTDDEKAAAGRVDQLNRMLVTLRQENVRRVVRTGSRSASPSTSASDAQIATLEGTLAAEAASRNTLKAKLDQELADRNAEIERRIQSSPNAVPKLAGLSGQLEALTALTKDDPKLLLFIIAFQVISLALELSPMWISLSDRYFPSSYAAHLAMQHFIDVTKISDEGARRLGVHPDSRKGVRGIDAEGLKPEAPTPDVAGSDASRPEAGVGAGHKQVDASEPANENHQSTSELNGATPKRGRGRPRGSSKNGLDQSSKENGHD
jgi:hypothetical protein